MNAAATCSKLEHACRLWTVKVYAEGADKAQEQGGQPAGRSDHSRAVHSEVRTAVFSFACQLLALLLLLLLLLTRYSRCCADSR